MIYLLLMMWLCNLIDVIATLYLYGLGFMELNPFMAILLRVPICFAVFKLSAMTGLCLYLWENKNNKYAKYCSIIGSVVFILIAVYYIVFYILWLK